MMAKVMTSQLLKNIRISKDVLDNMIGKPVLSSTGEVIGKISGHSENLAVIYMDFDPCCVCGKLTDQIEYNYEAYLCSPKCEAFLGKIATNKRS